MLPFNDWQCLREFFFLAHIITAAYVPQLDLEAKKGFAG